MLISRSSGPQHAPQLPGQGGGWIATEDEAVPFTSFLDHPLEGEGRRLYAFGALGLFARHQDFSQTGSSPAMGQRETFPHLSPEPRRAAVPAHYGANRNLSLSVKSLGSFGRVSFGAAHKTLAPEVRSQSPVPGGSQPGPSVVHYASLRCSAPETVEEHPRCSFFARSVDGSPLSTKTSAPQFQLTMMRSAGGIEIVIRVSGDALAGRDTLIRALSKVSREFDVDIAALTINGDVAPLASFILTGGTDGSSAD